MRHIIITWSLRRKIMSDQLSVSPLERAGRLAALAAAGVTERVRWITVGVADAACRQKRFSQKFELLTNLGKSHSKNLGHKHISLKFTFTNMVEVQIPENNTQCTFPKIGR